MASKTFDDEDVNHSEVISYELLVRAIAEGIEIDN